MATTFRMPAAAGWIKREEEELPDSLATVDTTRPTRIAVAVARISE